MIFSSKVKKILNQRAKDCDLEIGQAEEIYKLLGRFVRDSIKSADNTNPDSFKNIYIKGLGTFSYKRYLILRVIEKRKGLKLKEENELSK